MPTWRDLLAPEPAGQDAVALALGVELRQLEVRDTARWTPRRTQTASARGLARRRDGLLIGLRPLVRSRSTGAWIKGDASWEALRRPGGAFDPAQARWFAELHSISREVRTLGPLIDVSEWITLDTIESELVWHHFAAAAGRGIPFVATMKSQSVSLAVGATVTLEASPTLADGVRIAPVVRLVPDGGAGAIDVDAALVRPIGSSGVYAYEVVGDRIRLTLAPAPLGDTARTLLAADAPIDVPPEDAAEFLQMHLPRLARRAPLTMRGGLALPAPIEPVLAVRIEYLPADTVRVELAWDYGALGRFPSTPPGPTDADRDPEAELRIVRALAEAWTDSLAGTLTLRGIDAAEFVAHTLPGLDAVAGVRVDSVGERRAYSELVGDPEIRITSVETTDADWFDLGIIVTIDGRTIPFGPLFAALTLGKRKLLLSDGKYFSLAHPALDRLKELLDEAGELTEWETGPRISRYQTALWADFEDLADEAEPAVSWRATAAGLRDVERIEPTPVPAGVRAELRPYQRTGYDWLAFLWHHRLGGILADDMGLGKTLQMLALILHARDAGEVRPFLVVAPTSVLPTWQSEAARFAPGLVVRVIDATAAKSGVEVSEVAASADLVVTSYALLRLDEARFADARWAALVLDEAQFVKNPATRLHRAAKAVRAEATFAITGTPMENSLTELWSLLSLTAPGLFPSARRFRDEYVKPIEHGKVPENEEGGAFRAGRLARLRRRIRPLVLRRTKENVAPDLPPRQEQELHIALSPAHRALYDTVLQRERQKVLGLLEDLDRHRFIVFRSLTLLRMLSLAPALIDAADARIGSSKLDALLEQLVEVVAEGHRALVFSQFTSFLALARDRLDAAGIAYAELDGSTRRRADVIEDFRNGEAPVFLISLKAGGFGLTLTEADYVFLLDPWWNPAAEAQAVDRTHRIGQTRPVMVYRMIAASTIEEKVMALQRRKARLFRAVVDDGDLFSQSLTADDIRGLLEA